MFLSLCAVAAVWGSLAIDRRDFSKTGSPSPALQGRLSRRGPSGILVAGLQRFSHPVISPLEVVQHSNLSRFSSLDPVISPEYVFSLLARSNAESVTHRSPGSAAQPRHPG